MASCRLTRPAQVRGPKYVVKRGKTPVLSRVSAAATLRVEDYFENGKRAWLRLHEKGGKRHEVPCHHNLATYLL